jgi:DNA-binding NtrC family response regulator
MAAGKPCEPRFEGWAGCRSPPRPKQKGIRSMESSLPATGIPASAIHPDLNERLLPPDALPTVLLATVDATLGHSILELLQMYPVKTIQARGVDEVRGVLAKETVTACFCGFWLVDGTYRDVVRLLKRQPLEIPAIIVCAPACPHEYRDYLAALNIRAFDFICHPYRKTDMERILRAAISKRSQSGTVQGSRSSYSVEIKNEPRLRKAG